MGQVFFVFGVLLFGLFGGKAIGTVETERNIISTCMIAHEVQVSSTVIYCKPIAIMVGGQRQELKDGSITSTQP